MPLMYCKSAEKRFDKQDNVTQNSYHMLYYFKRCISHAYLLQCQHINDYSWITYLKNQVLNLHHSVREKKKHLYENSNHSEVSIRKAIVSVTEYVSNVVQKGFAREAFCDVLSCFKIRK